MPGLTINDCPSDLSYIFRECTVINQEQLYSLILFFHHLTNEPVVKVIYFNDSPNLIMGYQTVGSMFYYLTYQLEYYYSKSSNSFLLTKFPQVQKRLDNQEFLCYHQERNTGYIEVGDYPEDTITCFDLLVSEAVARMGEYPRIMKTDNKHYRKFVTVQPDPGQSMIEQQISLYNQNDEFELVSQQFSNWKI